MHNPYHPEPAKISHIARQTENIKLFRFEFLQKIWGYKFNFKPGQFIELSVPGFGEAPFAPCSAPGGKAIELCVRIAGKLTQKLHSMKTGDKVYIRGPYGQGWPIIADSKSPAANRNLLIVVGGLGLVPLRTLILGKDKFLDKDANVQVFYGAKSPDEMLFRHEYPVWQKENIQLRLTVDKECPNWKGCVGLIPTLFDKYDVASDSVAFLCGPPVMYKFVLEKLKAKGLADENIYLSLERRMHCGIGVCQHCAVGPYYTCEDGPVFNYGQIKNIPGAI
jgi:NAD(P)H-flavin reductase